MPGIDENRAAEAWEFVGEVKNDEKQEYEAQVKKLPSHIMANGLGQTLAFLYTKKKAHKRLLRQCGRYLKERGIIGNAQDEEAVIQAVVELDEDRYHQATDEILRMADWLRRFVAGRFGG